MGGQGGEGGGGGGSVSSRKTIHGNLETTNNIDK